MLNTHLKLQIDKLKREHYRASAKHSRRMLNQMEFWLEEIEVGASEDTLVAVANRL